MIDKLKWQNHTEEDTTDASTDVDARIADLAAKIDRLTELVVSLQPTKSSERPS